MGCGVLEGIGGRVLLHLYIREGTESLGGEMRHGREAENSRGCYLRRFKATLT
jgi:hypothetical protein